MAQNETWLKHDLLEAVKVQYLDGNLFSMDNAGNLIGVTLTRNGEDYSGGGSVSANVIRSDGGTIAVTGALSGKIATVVLPQAAYAVPGVVSIIVKLTASGQVTTIAALVANVYRSSTDTAVDPGTIIPSIQTLISQINTAVASIPADYSALWTKLAPAFSTDASYVAGQYVTYNSGLYRFNTSHSGSWSSSDVTAVNLGGEISDLKSAFDNITIINSEQITGDELENYTISTERNEVIPYQGQNVNRYFLKGGITYFINTSSLYGLGQYTPGAVTIKYDRILTPGSNTYLFVNESNDNGVYFYNGATMEDVEALEAKVPTIAKQIILQKETVQPYLRRTLSDGEYKCTYSDSGGSIIWNATENYLTVELDNSKVYDVHFDEMPTSAIRAYILKNGSNITYETFTELKILSSTWYSQGISITKIAANTYRIKKYQSSGDNTQIFITLVNANVESGKSFIQIEEKIIPEWLDYNRNPIDLFVAASDATDAEKKYADYVCTGTNDQSVIQMAIVALGRCGTLHLSSGTFNIDNFDNYYNTYYAAIHRHVPDDQWYFDITIKGTGKFGTRKTTLKVTSTFNSNIGSVSEVAVIGGYGYGCGINIEDFEIVYTSNQYPIIGFNGQHLGHGNVKNVTVRCAENSATTQATVPNEKCVGLRSFIGDDNGTQSIWESIVVVGAYTGFQLGAEHMIIMQCGTRFCFYGYSFGDYSIVFGENFIHPVTLINCCDEHSARLPKFVKCGDMVNEHTVDHPLQEVTMISFNIEKWPGDWGTYWKCAEETNPGDFCGRIEYTLNGQSTPGGGEDWSSHSNHYSAQFWEAGSGINFTTVNMAHRKGGDSTLRLKYYPNYMQQYFDTTLNKLLTCIDPANKTWVDANGTNVDA